VDLRFGGCSLDGVLLGIIDAVTDVEMNIFVEEIDFLGYDSYLLPQRFLGDCS
jgi:hypothetical protein